MNTNTQPTEQFPGTLRDNYRPSFPADIRQVIDTMWNAHARIMRAADETMRELGITESEVLESLADQTPDMFEEAE